MTDQTSANNPTFREAAQPPAAAANQTEQGNTSIRAEKEDGIRAEKGDGIRAARRPEPPRAGTTHAVLGRSIHSERPPPHTDTPYEQAADAPTPDALARRN